MAVKYSNPLSSSADLTLVQTDAVVTVSGNKITSVITTNGASWNGAYQSANLVTIATNDRMYFKMRSTVDSTPYVYLGSKRSPAGSVPDGFLSTLGFQNSSTLRSNIFESAFGTVAAIDPLSAPLYMVYVFEANAITPYYNQTGHSSSLSDYTAITGLTGGDEVGETDGLLLSHLGSSNGETIEVYPYAYTDSGGLTPPASTDLTAVWDDEEEAVLLEWTNNGLTETNCSFQSIERSETSGSGFVEIDQQGEDDNDYLDTGGDPHQIVPGTTYYYRIRPGIIFDGETYYSDYSNEVSAEFPLGGFSIRQHGVMQGTTHGKIQGFH